MACGAGCLPAAAGAGILAAQMLAVGDEALTARLASFKEEMARSVAEKDAKVCAQMNQ